MTDQFIWVQGPHFLVISIILPVKISIYQKRIRQPVSNAVILFEHFYFFPFFKEMKAHRERMHEARARVCVCVCVRRGRPQGVMLTSRVLVVV